MSDQSVTLIWEDDTSATPAWWSSRAGYGDRQFFIARDPVTADLLGIIRTPSAPYTVIAVNRCVDGAVTALKLRVAELAGTELVPGPDVRGWRARRAIKRAVGFVPLALLATLTGAMIGAAVALFAISTGLLGWPMAVVGVVFGAGTGLVLKALVERRRGPDDGAWPRFLAATVFAALGAAVAAGGLLVLFRN